VKHIKYIIAGLLDLVVPHCSGCIRPAVKYEGTTFSTEKPTDAKRYACEEHATAGIKWTDLPGAPIVRAAYAFIHGVDKQTERSPCPCLHTTPCHPRCTCIESFSSSGCRRCCTYGSPEQQAAKARYLANIQLDSTELKTLVDNLPKCAADCGSVGTRTYDNAVMRVWCDEHRHGSYGDETDLKDLPYASVVRSFLARQKKP
jgi:hypothetical protein